MSGTVFGSKLFDTLVVVLILFKKSTLKKKLQIIIKKKGMGRSDNNIPNIF